MNKEIIANIFFNQIIDEAKTGEIKVDYIDNNLPLQYVLNIGFNTCIKGKLLSGDFDDDKPILMINNSEQLITLLEQYINECDKIETEFKSQSYETRAKIYMSQLWANAIYEDFADPITFLTHRIDFFKNKLTINNEYMNNVKALDNSNILISNNIQKLTLETPYSFNVIIKNDECELPLPEISYGISNNECYIYAIQNKQIELTKEQKKINRKLYKINEDVINSETDEYIDYKNGDSYYPENISDVSPSAILALTIFLNTLNQNNITSVKLITLLPIRYNSKEESYRKKYEYQVKVKNLDDIQSKKLLLEYKLERLRIQKNLSEKIIRDFRRIEHHFPNCMIMAYPMEMDEYMHLNVNEFKYTDNELLNEVIGNHKNNITK